MRWRAEDKAGNGRKTPHARTYYSITMGTFVDFLGFVDGALRPAIPASAMELLGKLMGPFRVLA
jgi:hypothetical protein